MSQTLSRFISCLAPIATAIGLLSLSSTALYAQTPSELRLINQFMPQRQDPAVEETIATARADLQSEDAEMRRGSVMLLAKYPMSQGVMADIARALQDPAATVRRAAIVSLIENIQYMDPSSAAAALAALADPDDEVRLNVAGALQNLLMLSQSRLGGLGRASQSADPAHARIINAIRAAITDSQPLVRTQTLAAIRFLPGTVDGDKLIAALQDPVVEVRLAAYETASSLLNPDRFLQAIADRYPDPDPRVRLLAAEMLTRITRTEALPLIEVMRNDELASVRLHAEVARFQLRPWDGLNDALISAFNDGRLSQADQQRIFFHLQGMEPAAQRRIAEALLPSNHVQARMLAVSVWLNADPAAASDGELIEFLKDPAPEVRQQVLRFLMNPARQLSDEIMAALPQSSFEDVRQQAFNVTRQGSPEQRTQLALALLTDPVPAIRQQALTQIVALRPPVWQRILRASLRDPDFAVQRIAATALMRQLGPEGRAIATEFAKANPDRPVSDLIRSM